MRPRFNPLARTRGRAPRRGVAAVEFAIVLPFLMLILFGVWEMGRLIQVMQVVSNAAREGGRLCATGTATSSTATPELPGFMIQKAVANYLHNSGLPLPESTTTVRVSRFVGGSTTPTSVATVTVNAPAAGATDMGVTLSGSAPASDPTLSADQFDIILIEVNYPFRFARWMPLNAIFSVADNTTVYGAARWPCMRDKPVAIDATIPQSPLQ